MECPVCLEQLSGTVVEMGCCHKQVHIQCYVTTCPMCRAPLPAPIHALPSQPHVLIPVPVALPPAPVPRWKILLANSMFLVGVGGLVTFVLSPYFR